MNADKLLTFDRWDFLATRVLLALIALAATSLLVIKPLWDLARGNPLHWSLNLDIDGLSTATVSAQSGAQLAWDGAARVILTEPSTAVWIATFVPKALVAATIVAIVVILYRLMAQIHRGAPFVRSSVRGLRVIALILLIVPWVIVPFAGRADSVVTREALTISGPESFTLFTGSFVLMMGVGLMVAAIAEAFAQGQKLQDEVEGLI